MEKRAWIFGKSHVYVDVTGGLKLFRELDGGGYEWYDGAAPDPGRKMDHWGDGNYTWTAQEVEELVEGLELVAEDGKTVPGATLNREAREELAAAGITETKDFLSFGTEV